jgi:hypothetical protein
LFVQQELPLPVTSIINEASIGSSAAAAQMALVTAPSDGSFVRWLLSTGEGLEGGFKALGDHVPVHQVVEVCDEVGAAVAEVDVVGVL